MEQIVHHEQCLRCHECCRFRADRQDFAPIFTIEEVERIRAAGKALPEFTPFKATDNVLQIRLKQAENDDPVYPYVCPFLDETDYRCTIYETRPFDCRVWPFIVLKEAETGQVKLAHFTGSACLAVEEASEAAFEAYENYMKQFVTSANFLGFLRQYPQLIWDHDGHGNYATIPVLDITDLLAPPAGE